MRKDGFYKKAPAMDEAEGLIEYTIKFVKKWEQDNG